MKTETKAEHEIDSSSREAIQELLSACFPQYPSRTYYKQLPHLRHLAWEDGILAAQVGIDHRMIKNGDTALRIFGIIDLCVAASARSRGIASRLLAEVEAAARTSGVDAILLFADDPRIYLANGYEKVANCAKWLMINDHETLGIAEKPIAEMMVKMLSGDSWDEGSVDLLGYLF
ncbi:GNAT family N-acetyltransferase [Streptomyces pseudovenezuelae]|uniref:N-acetyltransferase YhbS n=1 Tax=Streptomyces pseudovenezuelae TaxID=67350 RepID=A0ABT6M2V4_9ACTN|nr:GNAT family N-acetyltransferase [Streptomyces pseudovenezuelae]MDH6221984.1 putative N-acetyltransferase YhbS [Streptomyces pseudovenezuelae]